MAHQPQAGSNSNSPGVIANRSGSQLAALMVVVFVGLLGGPVLTTLWRLGATAILDGPNTVGEAGKVFYAHRFQEGYTIFLRGHEPPYYPSVHGPLLHVVVGAVGRAIRLEPERLYFVGRFISVTCAVLGLACCGAVLRHLEAGRVWLLVAGVAFLAYERVLQHSVSYRPDFWIFFLSAGACWLFVAHSTRWWALAALTVLPVVAFFIKAPGIWILGATVLALCGQGRWRPGIICGFSSACLLTGSISIVQWISHGALLDSFLNGMKVPFARVHYRVLFEASQAWLPLVLPLVIGPAVIASERNQQIRQKWLIVLMFWGVSLLAGLVTMSRAGSDMNYLLDSYAFGMVMFVAWIARVLRGDFRSWLKRGVPVAAVGVAAIFVLLNLGPWYRTLLDSPPADIAVMKTQQFGPFRKDLATEINSRGWRCFSDDAGLNILLDRPAVIYSLLPGMMIRSGALSADEFLGPIRRQEYDLIVLTGIQWWHGDAEDPPQILLDAIKKHYQVIPNSTKYRRFVPRTNRAS